MDLFKEAAFVKFIFFVSGAMTMESKSPAADTAAQIYKVAVKPKLDKTIGAKNVEIADSTRVTPVIKPTAVARICVGKSSLG